MMSTATGDVICPKCHHYQCVCPKEGQMCCDPQMFFSGGFLGASNTSDQDEDDYEYQEWKENVDSGLLKNEINTLIWTHGNPDWTLAKAERVACEIHDLLAEEDIA